MFALKILQINISDEPEDCHKGPTLLGFKLSIKIFVSLTLTDFMLLVSFHTS